MKEARALILDVAHRALLLRTPDDTWNAPTTVARVGERRLVAIVAFARERFGVELPHPSGALPRNDDPRDFVFVLPPGSRVDAHETLWVPMRDLDPQSPHAGSLWALYIETMLGGWEPPTRTLDVFAFGRGPRDNASLAHLVTKGPKRATAGWVAGEQATGGVIPTPGLVSIVTDGYGFPVCAIESERVDHVRFGDVPEDFARAEGEGDGSLDDWREGHRRYFEAMAAEIGQPFDDDAIVFLERFKLLRVFARGG